MSVAPAQVALQIATSDQVVPAGVDWVAWVDAALDAARSAPQGAAELGASTRPSGAMTVRLVGRSESQHLNETFRRKSGPTNVLAFPGFAGDDPVLGAVADADSELGDLVICLPVVYTEAAEQGKTPLAHMAHLVVHGTLHLAGFDHEDDDAAEEMEGLETEVMMRLGYLDPYQAGDSRIDDQ